MWRNHPATIEKLKTLEPEVQVLAEKLLDDLQAHGVEAIITWGRRTPAQQAALYAQGREPLADVNALRKAAGMAPLAGEENLRKVSWNRNSPHLSGRAFDIAILSPNGNVDWSAAAYELPGRLGTELGLTWGGSWKSKADLPHFELKR